MSVQAQNEARGCVVMGLTWGHNIPNGVTLDLHDWKDVVVVDRHYLLSHAAEVLEICKRIDEHNEVNK